MNSSYSIKHILIFIFLQVLLISYFYTSLERKEKTYNEQQILELQKEYKTIENLYKSLTTIIYEGIINKPEFLTVIEGFEKVSKEEQNLRRQALYMKLSSFYNRLKNIGFEQLHFHTIDNRSILRFHQPEQFGDRLAENRFSIFLANKNKTRIHGFEEGIYFNGYRNIFPIIFDSKHIGSVEISLKFQDFKKKLSENFNKDFKFIIANNVTKKNILTETKNIIYQKSTLSKHFLEEIVEEKNTIIDKSILKALNQTINNEEQLNLLKRDAFVKNIEIFNQEYTVSFLPIKNIASEELAFIVSYKKDGNLKVEVQKAILFFFLINAIAIAFLVLFFYAKRNKEMSFVKTILDSQDNKLLITDGKNAKEINKPLLNFLGYESLEEFKKEHECVCDFFIKEEGYLYPNNKNEWLNYILENNQESKVKILDEKSKVEKIFILRVTKLKNKKLYIVSFNDISSIEIEKSQLDLESKTDKLTKQFNKRKFEQDLQEKINYSQKYSSKFSIIMYDLDHFKRINDTFGHQCGDEVLERVSKVIRENTRDNDLLYRWGGEEFIILTNTTENNAIFLAEKLRKKIEECYFFNIGKITCSFGVTEYTLNDNEESILKRADGLLYRAKHEGRNRVCSIE